MGHCNTGTGRKKRKAEEEKKEMALEWLKEILGEAYSEELEEKISGQIGKGFVSKADFNKAKGDLKTANETIQTQGLQLQEAGTAAQNDEELKRQLEAKDAEIQKMKVDIAVERALTAAKAKNMVAAKALLAEFLQSAEQKEDGSIDGLAEQIERLKQAEDTGFLFARDQAPVLRGIIPAEGKDGLPGETAEPKSLRDAVSAALTNTRKQE